MVSQSKRTMIEHVKDIIKYDLIIYKDCRYIDSDGVDQVNHNWGQYGMVKYKKMYYYSLKDKYSYKFIRTNIPYETETTDDVDDDYREYYPFNVYNAVGIIRRKIDGITKMGSTLEKSLVFVDQLDILTHSPVVNGEITPLKVAQCSYYEKEGDNSGDAECIECGMIIITKEQHQLKIEKKKLKNNHKKNVSVVLHQSTLLPEISKEILAFL